MRFPIVNGDLNHSVMLVLVYQRVDSCYYPVGRRERVGAFGPLVPYTVLPIREPFGATK